MALVLDNNSGKRSGANIIMNLNKEQKQKELFCTQKTRTISMLLTFEAFMDKHGIAVPETPLPGHGYVDYSSQEFNKLWNDFSHK